MSRGTKHPFQSIGTRRHLSGIAGSGYLPANCRLAYASHLDESPCKIFLIHAPALLSATAGSASFIKFYHFYSKSSQALIYASAGAVFFDDLEAPIISLIMLLQQCETHYESALQILRIEILRPIPYITLTISPVPIFVLTYLTKNGRNCTSRAASTPGPSLAVPSPTSRSLLPAE